VREETAKAGTLLEEASMLAHDPAHEDVGEAPDTAMTLTDWR
jgi:hypothetical protein